MLLGTIGHFYKFLITCAVFRTVEILGQGGCAKFNDTSIVSFPEQLVGRVGSHTAVSFYSKIRYVCWPIRYRPSWSLDDFTEVKRHTMPINFRNEGGASLHPGGDRFIAGGSDLWVRVFDFETGTQMECLKVHLFCNFFDPPRQQGLTEP